MYVLSMMQQDGTTITITIVMITIVVMIVTTIITTTTTNIISPSIKPRTRDFPRERLDAVPGVLGRPFSALRGLLSFMLPTAEAGEATPPLR